MSEGGLFIFWAKIKGGEGIDGNKYVSDPARTGGDSLIMKVDSS